MMTMVTKMTIMFKMMMMVIMVIDDLIGKGAEYASRSYVG